MTWELRKQIKFRKEDLSMEKKYDVEYLLKIVEKEVEQLKREMSAALSANFLMFLEDIDNNVYGEHSGVIFDKDLMISIKVKILPNKKNRLKLTGSGSVFIVLDLDSKNYMIQASANGIECPDDPNQVLSFDSLKEEEEVYPEQFNISYYMDIDESEIN